ncbi:MAG: hypothetical protein AAF787_09055, partial [Chloroflexota bacterium]
RRLRADTAYLLTEMLLCTPPVPPGGQPTQPNMPPIAATIPEQANTRAGQPFAGSNAAPTAEHMRPVPPPQADDSSVVDTMVHPTGEN